MSNADLLAATIVMGVLACALVGVIVYRWGYNRGFDDGYSDGYADGIQSGFDAGVEYMKTEIQLRKLKR